MSLSICEKDQEKSKVTHGPKCGKRNNTENKVNSGRTHGPKWIEREYTNITIIVSEQSKWKSAGPPDHFFGKRNNTDNQVNSDRTRGPKWTHHINGTGKVDTNRRKPTGVQKFTIPEYIKNPRRN